MPALGRGPGVIVIQEWWGLNPQIKGVADMLAENGIVALAPDLYHGELAGHDDMDKAGELKGMGNDVELTIHQAGHGFMNEENPLDSHDEGLAGEICPTTIEFFKNQLA